MQQAPEIVLQETPSLVFLEAIDQFLRGEDDGRRFFEGGNLAEEMENKLLGKEYYQAFIKLELVEKRSFLIRFILNFQQSSLFEAADAVVKPNGDKTYIDSISSSIGSINLDLMPILHRANQISFQHNLLHSANTAIDRNWDIYDRSSPLEEVVDQAALNRYLYIAAADNCDALLVHLLNLGAKDEQNRVLRILAFSNRLDLLAFFMQGRLASDSERRLKVKLDGPTNEQLFDILDYVIQMQEKIIEYGLSVLNTVLVIGGIDGVLLWRMIEDPRKRINDLGKTIEFLLKGGTEIDYAWIDQEGFSGTLLARMVKKYVSLPKNAEEQEKQTAKRVIQFLLDNGANPEDAGINDPYILKELGKTMPELIFDYHFYRAQIDLAQLQEGANKSDEKSEFFDEESSNILKGKLEKALKEIEPFFSRQNELLTAIVKLIREKSRECSNDSLRREPPRKIVEKILGIPKYSLVNDSSKLQALCRVAEEMLGIRIDQVKCREDEQEMMPMSANATAVASPSDYSPLFVAAASRGAKETVARFLVLWGERLSQDNKLSALYQAASQGHAEIVRTFLIDGGLTEEAMNARVRNHGGTAVSNLQASLNIAAANGHLNVIKLLMGYGVEDVKPHIEADTEIKNDNRPLLPVSALEYATANNHKDVIAFLLSTGAKIGNALQIAVSKDPGLNLAKFFVETAKQQEGSADELRSALLHAAKIGQLDTIKLLFDQDVPLTREILNTIAANFDDQRALDIFSCLKHSRHREGALRAAIDYGHFDTAKYLLLTGVKIDYLASEGKTLLENLAQKIEASLKQHGQAGEELKAVWKTKLAFFLSHSANPEVLNNFPKVLELLGEKTTVKLTFNYLFGQAIDTFDQNERHEDDSFQQIQALQNRLLSSLDNAQRSAEKPASRFPFFKDKLPTPEVIADIRQMCEIHGEDVQALEILIGIAEKEGIKVKPNSSAAAVLTVVQEDGALQHARGMSVVGSGRSLN
ncbi:MAG: serine/threonine-protein phosphatase 6 regulatory ankyrin repeat subunit B-like [Gammaproteobacteria bacterium]|nr:serine/threonine-protein phosphatase 6 regulatory ankyrin repeat subunit B-like [Gammaproteobacteria bacterium]